MPVVTGPATPAGGTAVPTDGTFVNANWVETLYADHNFTGRTILTNGLLLLDIQTGQARLARCYLWSTGLATPAWQQCFDLTYQDNAGNASTLRSITCKRIGPEESSVVLVATTSGGKAAQVTLRLQRGRYEARVDFMPLVEANTNDFALALIPVSTPAVQYNSTFILDGRLAAEQTITGKVATDYGYGANFSPSASFPFIHGFLYQNQAADMLYRGAGGNLYLGDTSGPAVNARRSYGFYALPYGVNGSYSTANLQAEAESGTLGTGWTSQANAAASAGNEAKCASGTATTNADLWGTAFVPDPGTYDLWVRMKVASAASATPQMQVGLWNSTDGAFVDATIYAPNQLTTAYAWYRVSVGVTPTATKNMRVRAVVATNATNTDWFIDESALVPKTLTTSHDGPQDIFQQWLYDRSAQLVRP